MKKTFAFLLAAVCLLTFTVTAFAAPVPSKTINNMVAADNNAQPTVPGASTFVVSVVANTAATSAALKNLQSHVGGGKNAASFFGAGIASYLPNGVSASSLVVNEFATVAVSSFSIGEGIVTVSFSFATQYKNGQTVVAAVGVPNADGTVSWHLVSAKVQNGAVLVSFPTDVIKAINGNTFALAILSA